VLVSLLGAEIVLAAWLGFAGITALRRSAGWRTWTAASAVLIVVAGAGYAWMLYCVDDLLTASDSTRHLPFALGAACFLLWATRTRQA
jgi:hypothetical protein